MAWSTCSIWWAILYILCNLYTTKARHRRKYTSHQPIVVFTLCTAEQLKTQTYIHLAADRVSLSPIHHTGIRKQPFCIVSKHTHTQAHKHIRVTVITHNPFTEVFLHVTAGTRMLSTSMLTAISVLLALLLVWLPWYKHEACYSIDLHAYKSMCLSHISGWVLILKNH